MLYLYCIELYLFCTVLYLNAVAVTHVPALAAGQRAASSVHSHADPALQLFYYINFLPYKLVAFCEKIFLQNLIIFPSKKIEFFFFNLLSCLKNIFVGSQFSLFRHDFLLLHRTH